MSKKKLPKMPSRIYVYWNEGDGCPFLEASVSCYDTLNNIYDSKIIGVYDLSTEQKVSATVKMEDVH